MSKMKNQLETLAAKMNDGDITITDKLMGLVEKHSVRMETEYCWCWTAGTGETACGGIGALAKFLNGGGDNLSHQIHAYHLAHQNRLTVGDIPVWTRSNGG
jgi:hypothetical protein